MTCFAQRCNFYGEYAESGTSFRPPSKADLADEMWKAASTAMPNLPIFGMDIHHVVDGGALLHLIPWERGVTYATIVHSYVRFIMKRFKHCTVVFDGYSSDPSTKDVVHARRCKGKSSPEIRFTPDMSIQW